MNLSSIVHEHHNSYSHQSILHHSKQPRTTRNRTTPIYEGNMAAILTPNSYTSQPHLHTHTSPSPLSPPALAPNKRLPSIKSLIGMSESEVPENEQSEVEKQPQELGQDSQHPDSRSQSISQPALSNASTSTPTPPAKSEFSDRLAQSPSATSSHSSTSVPPYFGAPVVHMDPALQRQPPPSSHPGHPGAAPTSQSPYQASPYPPSPSGVTSYSYPLPAHQPPQAQGLYYQRPLPNSFPPPTIPTTLAPSISTPHDGSPVDQSNPWQHHHYISPTSSTDFPGQSQDRYVCQTCNKAFSRPSSLKIHSHSHTGEKPFKCPHPGCGKAFSVRSNMKRHERGCHGGGGVSGSPEAQ